MGGPKWDNLPQEQRPERGLLALRKELDLFANLRPAKCFPMLVDASPLKRSVVEGTDLMVIRELTGGLYFGEPRGRRAASPTAARARSTRWSYTSREIERVARVGFDVARKRRKRLTSVDKANVLVGLPALARGGDARRPRTIRTSTLEHVLVDNCAMALVHKPTQFDTIVTENTFGDILSDEAAILAGSMGMLPSASLGGGGRRLYEPVHGTAPDIAGQGHRQPDRGHPVGGDAPAVLAEHGPRRRPRSRRRCCGCWSRATARRDIAAPGREGGRHRRRWAT